MGSEHPCGAAVLRFLAGVVQHWLQQWGCSWGTPILCPPGLLWGHPRPLVPQAFEWRVTGDMMGSVATAPRGSSCPSPSLAGSGHSSPVLEDLENQTQWWIPSPFPSPAGIHSPFSSPGLICFSWSPVSALGDSGWDVVPAL